MRDITSLELAGEMTMGWNLGNTLEAVDTWSEPGKSIPCETCWGNPLVDQSFIDSVYAAGFDAIRIPVAWSKFSDEENFIIEEEWKERVEEVVNYALNNNMYVIMNIHWDGGWMQPTYEDQDYVNNRLDIMWTQIAEHFRDYGDYLLFAGTNEVMVDGDYGRPTEEYYTVQNSFNQTFVNAVRATGGNNDYRHLVVQGFNTNITWTLDYFEIPEDTIDDRLMVEVHYYDPYNFTLNEGNKDVIQWGQYVTDPSRTETWANESYADDQFNSMKTRFADEGYPVILGEYGALARYDLENEQRINEHREFRRYYLEYITHSLVEHGLVPFYWDNGPSENNDMGIFDRDTGEQAYPTLIEAMMRAAHGEQVKPVSIPTSVEQEEKLPQNISLSANYPNPFNPTTEISYHVPSTSDVMLSVYDIMGRKVAVLKEGRVSAGNHTVTFEAGSLSSGMYLYRLEVGNQVLTRKMMLVK